MKSNFSCLVEAIPFATPDELAANGFYAIHGAGIELRRPRGVLFIGPAGTGKSTIAIAAVRSGRRIVSDDVALLRLRQDGVSAYPYLPFVVTKDETGARIQGYEDFDHFAGFCAIHVCAVLFPRIDPGTNEFQLVSTPPTRTLLRLVRQSAWPLRKDHREGMGLALRKLAELPAYELLMPKRPDLPWSNLFERLEGMLC